MFWWSGCQPGWPSLSRILVSEPAQQSNLSICLSGQASIACLMAASFLSWGSPGCSNLITSWRFSSATWVEGTCGMPARLQAFSQSCSYGEEVVRLGCCGEFSQWCGWFAEYLQAGYCDHAECSGLTFC